MQRRVALIGASGYTGIELTRLLVGHPSIELAVASSDRWVGASIEGKVGAPSALRYLPLADAIAQAASCDVVMLATPAEASLELVPQLLAAGPRVIDLSGAYRLRDASLYPRFYRFEHAHPELLATAVYGLPEYGGSARERIAGARLVANPGCYATAIQLALWPIVRTSAGARGLARSDRYIIDAMSGVTGAGRKASEDFSFAEIAGDVRAYRALKHQHRPEIEQELRAAVSFVPHLLPVARGILATCHVDLVEGTSPETVASEFAMYRSEAFVVLAESADDVSLHDVVGTNRCRIGWTLEGDHLVVTSAIDNLVKGAAGQAVQNLNLMLGFDERTGLAGLRSFHP
jgi:N-acetyl-gamma-glutamyl-phosphate reductase